MGAASIVLDVLDGGHFARRWEFYADLGFLPQGDPVTPGRVYIAVDDVRMNLIQKQ